MSSHTMKQGLKSLSFHLEPLTKALFIIITIINNNNNTPSYRAVLNFQSWTKLKRWSWALHWMSYCSKEINETHQFIKQIKPKDASIIKVNVLFERKLKPAF